MSRRTVVPGRADLAVRGQGSGPVDVLLLHAGVTDQRSWEPLVRALPEGRARCVSFDRRGFGSTAYKEEPGWSPVADAAHVPHLEGDERTLRETTAFVAGV